MKIYGRYFKDRAIDYFNRSKSIKDAIDLFNISRKTLYNWRKLYENDKLHLKTEHKKHISLKYTDDMCEYIRKYIVNNCRFRMKNLLKLFKKNFNRTLNANNVYYALRKSGITYKKAHKVVIINKKEHKQKVKEFKEKINEIGIDKVLSTDECHFHLNMTPDYGWNKKGKRVKFIKNSGNRSSFSLICTISNKQIIHYRIIESSVNANIILDYVKNINKKCRNRYNIFDNARVHHAKIVKHHMQNKSNKMIYNIPYNPETNPIEQFFNKVKTFVKKEDTSTRKKLISSIEKAMNTVTPENLNYYFLKSFEK